MNKFLVIILFVFLMFQPLRANEFNKLYDSGKYSKALVLLVNNKTISYEKFYNMGNCYFRLGQKGKALQYFKKAAFLSPRDKDIKHNISVVKLSLSDKEIEDGSFLQKIWELFIEAFSLNEISVFLLVIHLIGFVFMITLFKQNKHKQILTFLVLLSFSFLWGAKYVSYQYHKNAVLISQNTEVLSAPSSKSSILFTLHEGAEFTVLDSYNSWIRIGLGNGLSGWLKKTDVGIVNPLSDNAQ